MENLNQIRLAVENFLWTSELPLECHCQEFAPNEAAFHNILGRAAATRSLVVPEEFRLELLKVFDTKLDVAHHFAPLWLHPRCHVKRTGRPTLFSDVARPVFVSPPGLGL